MNGHNNIRSTVFTMMLMGFFSFFGCKSAQENKGNGKGEPVSLEAQLTEEGYERLFMFSGQEALHDLWEKHGAEGFQIVLENRDANNFARFLSAEVLFQKGGDPALSPSELAEIYTQSLATDFALLANPWGTPEHLDGLSKRVIVWGNAALPALHALLGNASVLQYIGSRDATTGTMLQARVKDFAAAMLADILGVSYEWQGTHAERDVWIENAISNQ